MLAPQCVQRPPIGRAPAPYAGFIVPPQTGQSTVVWAVSPSQTPARTSSSVGSPPNESKRLGVCAVKSIVMAHRRSSDAPHQADHLAQNPDLAAADRLHRLVLRLQAHVILLLEE